MKKLLIIAFATFMLAFVATLLAQSILPADGSAVSVKDKIYETPKEACWVVVYSGSQVLCIQSNSVLNVTASKYPMVRFNSLVQLTNGAAKLKLKIPQLMLDELTTKATEK